LIDVASAAINGRHNICNSNLKEVIIARDMLQFTTPVLSYRTCLAVERKSDQADWSRGWPAAYGCTYHTSSSPWRNLNINKFGHFMITDLTIVDTGTILILKHGNRDASINT
jgi:hypothetical protein